MTITEAVGICGFLVTIITAFVAAIRARVKRIQENTKRDVEFEAFKKEVREEMKAQMAELQKLDKKLGEAMTTWVSDRSNIEENIARFDERQKGMEGQLKDIKTTVDENHKQLINVLLKNIK